MPRVVTSWQTNLNSQATSAPQTDYSLINALQWMARSRVVARPQAVWSLIAKNAHTGRRRPPQEGGSTEDSHTKRKVRTIFGGFREVRNSRHMRDKYPREAKTPPHAMVQTSNGSSPRSTMPKPEDIIFTETDTSWMHHPHKDA